MRIFLLIIIASLSVSCSFLEKWRKPKPVVPAVSREKFLGTISMVNENAQFVLVDFGGFAAPSPGSEMRVLRSGEEIAQIRAGSEIRRPFAVADILTGAPHAGDDVWSKNPSP